LIKALLYYFSSANSVYYKSSTKYRNNAIASPIILVKAD